MHLIHFDARQAVMLIVYFLIYQIVLSIYWGKAHPDSKF